MCRVLNAWQPSAPIQNLKKRAQILRAIREFFYARSVVEVETPLMCTTGTTDAYLDSFIVTEQGQDKTRVRYLQTSPEFAMKRLLAAGIGDCYQISKAFRCDEAGRNHNPEFTLLEWYRLNVDHHGLMQDVDELLQAILHCPSAQRIGYAELFLEYFNLDPHRATLEEVKKVAQKYAPQILETLTLDTDSKDDWLMLLLAECIEPHLGIDRPCFIYDYPATQAALAKISADNVAQRFEVYIHGIELANGFHELQQPLEQLKRFQCDNEKRHALGKTKISIDYRLIAALEHGLPACAGVALGIDRLVMLALQAQNLSATLSFCFHTI